MIINDEKFSLMKFFSGFGNLGKVSWVLVLFLVFSFAKDVILSKMQKKLDIQQVGTYIEAPQNKKVNFFGIKIHNFGLGIIYEK